jgi:hypothetical protein
VLIGKPGAKGWYRFAVFDMLLILRLSSAGIHRWDNRTAFHAALIYYTKELGITCYASPQPVEYWQEDLDAEPVYDDDDDIEDLRSPLSPAEGSGQQQVPAPLAPLQPLMGFLPPEGSNMRRRKGFSRKRNMAGVGA